MNVDEHAGLTVLFCRGDSTSDPSVPTMYDDIPDDLLSGRFGPVLAACRSMPIHLVGPRPKKAVDALLAGRVLVVGDDSDLNAVVLRLLRKELFSAVEIGFAAASRTAFAELYSLPTGAAAVAVARDGSASAVPVVRNDSGGVLVGAAELTDMTGTFYVDAQRIAGGRPALIQVRPEESHGLTVTTTRRGPLGMGRRTETYVGRAAEFGIVAGGGTTITFDGIRHPREVNRWVFYRHTEPLMLIRP